MRGGKRLTVLVIFSILLISFVTVAIATGFFGTNTTKVSSLEKGLVAHYPLDGVYQTKDVTPYSNHGTNYGATLTTGVKDEPNGAYNFIDGTVTYIYCGKSLETAFSINDNFTISYWVYFPRMVGATIVKHGTASIGGFYDRIESTGLVRLNIGYSGGRYEIKTGDGEITAGKWYFITMKKEGDYGAIYIDGQNKTVSMPKISTMVQTTEDLILGMYSSGDSPFIGKASDVRIYNRALADDEIKLLYDSYKPKASASDLNKGLVGHWMLDAENGAKDLTPYGNHGTAQGGLVVGNTPDRKNKANGATLFDGINDYINCGNVHDFREDSSISFWVKGVLSASGDSQRILCTGTTTGNGFHVGISNSARRFYVRRNSGSLINSDDNTFTENELIHVAILSYKNGDVTYYVNGQVNGIPLQNTGVPLPDQTTLKIGSINGATGWLRTNIEDLRIYDRIITPDEIKLLYDSYKPKEVSVGNLNKGLVLDMPLTTKWMKSSTIVSDRTPYGNDGTLMNGVNITNEGAVFDGVNDYIDLGNTISFGNKGTISLWAKSNIDYPSDSSSLKYRGLIGKVFGGGTGGQSVFIDWVGTNTNHQLRFGIGDSINLQSFSVLNINMYNSWNLITASWDGSLMKLYFNDIIIGQISQSRNPQLITNPLVIGKVFNEWNGQISNVKIWNRALSDEEVKLLYEKGRGSE